MIIKGNNDNEGLMNPKYLITTAIIEIKTRTGAFPL
jgi:hypothetical protein